MEASPVGPIECPYCAELISAKSKKCRHCGEILDPQMRELEMLKKQQGGPHVFMNAGGGAASAAASTSSSSSNGSQQLRRFPHWMHILLTIFTGLFWLPIYLLMFIFRNRTIYY
ncbi:hypothetical protein [Aquibium sp. ELW1220]|uniref:hypothetical protein n=1 Tax=Aquibium sp. ELW1220 TaxID=2976766 RepID=UPI0025AF65A1|nr:hypothetical protein [Aquibium sp. ELW1220]MDN2578729.1 zinc ribbon domain-containing protein [Aquibium sp. ELW1220]